MAIYYIGTTGSDANVGTLDNPFASVSAANKVVMPGDTVYFLEGTYNNSTFNDGNIWKGGQDIVMRIDGVNGTADAPITYAAAPGAHVTIAYDGNGAIRISNSSYVNIQGFDIQGPSGQITMAEAIATQFAYKLPNDDTIYYRDPAAKLTASVASLGGVKPNYYESNAVMVGNNANHISITNNVIHDSPGYGISSLGGADYITITGNTLYNNSWWSSGTHGISIQNAVSSDTYDGVKIIISGNTLYDNYNRLVSWALPKTAPVTIVNDEGKGIQLQNNTTAGGFTHGQILVDNNLVVNSGNAGISENIVERITISNNTLIDNGYVNVLQSLGLGDPMLPAGYRVSDGGIRLQGGTDITIMNNVITQQAGLNALEGSTGLTAANANVTGNVFTGGNATNASAAIFGAGMAVAPRPYAAGTSSSDILYDGPASGYLYGGDGNDYLDGGAGSDTLLGGAGNDRIMYDAADVAANVSGGADTDTLVVVGGNLPISFNLEASSFEQAEWQQTDNAGQSWSTIIGRYNSDWQITSSSTILDNGMDREMLYDYTAPTSWQSRQLDYAAPSDGSALTYDYLIFDDLSSRDTSYDTDLATAYKSIRNDYDADGLRTYLYFVFEDNSARDTTLDYTTDLVWQSIRNDYNTTGQKTYISYEFDNGTQRDVSLDYGTGQIWQSLTQNYDATAQHKLTDQYFIFDNNTARYVEFGTFAGHPGATQHITNYADAAGTIYLNDFYV
jgi:hypothetical protein